MVERKPELGAIATKRKGKFHLVVVDFIANLYLALYKIALILVKAITDSIYFPVWMSKDVDPPIIDCLSPIIQEFQQKRKLLLLIFSDDDERLDEIVSCKDLNIFLSLSLFLDIRVLNTKKNKDVAGYINKYYDIEHVKEGLVVSKEFDTRSVPLVLTNLDVSPEDIVKELQRMQPKFLELMYMKRKLLEAVESSTTCPVMEEQNVAYKKSLLIDRRKDMEQKEREYRRRYIKDLIKEYNNSEYKHEPNDKGIISFQGLTPTKRMKSFDFENTTLRTVFGFLYDNIEPLNPEYRLLYIFSNSDGTSLYLNGLSDNKTLRELGIERKSSWLIDYIEEA